MPLPDRVTWATPARRDGFAAWIAPLAARHGLRLDTLRPASADASFRRYLRVDTDGGGSLIVMDAPPPQEDVRPFLHVAALIERAGLHSPRVLAADEALGFVLLADLGQTPYLQALSAADAAGADRLMRDAIGALVRWQRDVDATTLPPYDAALLQRELALFPEWCVQREYGIAWGERERASWERLTALLVASALAQPVVAVHRDWMPRNLMVAQPNPGILDFQDAVRGPVTYDIASLLRDAFVSWDEEREIDWAVRWWQQARDAGLFGEHPIGQDFGECWRALEWMGLQRHLKVLGIFCRLKHRDGKPAYAADLPRFFAYAVRVATRYRPLEPLLALLEPMVGEGMVATGYSLR
ncbi:phosphotransferase [Calidifontimicrobium sp. SYSU G02091]|uniref:aminoglycoside phosphotransferase family protein n=1 Tax=Calidifontimicrobium sp. SYSU G02091 TaxID=2926421 RepID=UPI001F53A29E|nr:phosphotransferase [Calidifontimicrobium sp. SYSU G02091]MCI1190274.1 phosphotransferase [Calidifontimicrobium sp. SYSU G02091]